MLNFQVLKASQVLPKKREPLEEKTLEQKFQEKKSLIWRIEHRKLREFHFIQIVHNGFLCLVNFKGEVIAKLEHPESLDTRRKIREIYVEIIKGSEEQNGGCFID